MFVSVVILSNSQGSLNNYMYREGLLKKSYFNDITSPTESHKHSQKIIQLLITTTTQALANMAVIQKHKSQGNKPLLKIIGTNIAFLQAGLTTVRYFWFPSFMHHTLIVTFFTWNHWWLERSYFLLWTACRCFKQLYWQWSLRPQCCDRRETDPGILSSSK